MVNKVILVGNLGKDPELTYTPNGAAVCKFSLATTERWTNRDGQKQESTEWHNIVIWRRLAEVANEFLRKGSRIYVEGRIKTRSWDAQDGTKRYMTEIEAQNFQMLSSRGEMSGGGGGGQQQRSQQNQQYQQQPQQQTPAAPPQQKQQQDSGYQYDYGSGGGGGAQQQSGGGQQGGGAPDQGFGNDDSDLPF